MAETPLVNMLFQRAREMREQQGRKLQAFQKFNTLDTGGVQTAGGEMDSLASRTGSVSSMLTREDTRLDDLLSEPGPLKDKQLSQVDEVTSQIGRSILHLLDPNTTLIEDIRPKGPQGWAWGLRHALNPGLRERNKSMDSQLKMRGVTSLLPQYLRGVEALMKAQENPAATAAQEAFGQDVGKHLATQINMRQSILEEPQLRATLKDGGKSDAWIDAFINHQRGIGSFKEPTALERFQDEKAAMDAVKNGAPPALVAEAFGKAGDENFLGILEGVQTQRDKPSEAKPAKPSTGAEMFSDAMVEAQKLYDINQRKVPNVTTSTNVHGEETVTARPGFVSIPGSKPIIDFMIAMIESQLRFADSQGNEEAVAFLSEKLATYENMKAGDSTPEDNERDYLDWIRSLREGKDEEP